MKMLEGEAVFEKDELKGAVKGIHTNFLTFTKAMKAGMEPKEAAKLAGPLPVIDSFEKKLAAYVVYRIIGEQIIQSGKKPQDVSADDYANGVEMLDMGGDKIALRH